jgi:NAD(P)-dependent dehydrogenase (short-subunit alcohol dehydrogenase family)
MATEEARVTVNTDKSLHDRVVLITGGSRGIGKAMAVGLAAAGARLVITASPKSPELDDAVAEIEQASSPGRALGIVADVRNYADCEAAVDAAVERFGTVHALVNNAGVGMGIIKADYPLGAPSFWEADPAQVARMLDTNVTGAFNMAMAIAPHLVGQGFGKIVNISTSTVTLTLKGFSPYGPSKAALEAGSLIWSRDLADKGVDVNVLLPGGATDTSIIPPFPGREERGGGIMPPTIMVPPISWLCSDQSNGVTGGRYIAKQWDASLPAGDAAARARDH